MSVPIVLDEWLFHDLLGENGLEKQRETFQFIYKLVDVCDRIVLLESSPFVLKFWDFVKKSGSEPKLRAISQFLKTSILTNSLKTIKLGKDEIKPVPEHLIKLIPLSDHYLLQAHLKLKNSFIVTTDGGWDFKKLAKQKTIAIKKRDQFIADYLK